MKLSPALLSLFAAGSMMTIGCGPGLSRPSKAPEAVFHAMDSELSHTIGTTTTTSATMDLSQLPEDRMPVDRLDNSVPVLDMLNPYTSPPKMVDENPYAPAVVVETWTAPPAAKSELLDSRE